MVNEQTVILQGLFVILVLYSIN